jgi:hypothetical protein
MIILWKVDRMKDKTNDVFRKLASSFLKELRENYESSRRENALAIDA